MRIGAWTFQINPGMVAAMVLLAAGGALYVLAREEDEALRTAGFGLVVAASVVYLAARIAMMTKGRDR